MDSQESDLVTGPASDASQLAAGTGLCRWCGAGFTSRAIAGNEQRFCSQACQQQARNAARRANRQLAGAGDGQAASYDPGLRRESPEEGSATEATPSLAAVEPCDAGACPGEAEALLDDLLLGLLDLPQALWEAVVAALPDALFDRVDQRLTAVFGEDAPQTALVPTSRTVTE